MLRNAGTNYSSEIRGLPGASFDCHAFCCGFRRLVDVPLPRVAALSRKVAAVCCCEYRSLNVAGSFSFRPSDFRVDGFSVLQKPLCKTVCGAKIPVSSVKFAGSPSREL